MKVEGIESPYTTTESLRARSLVEVAGLTLVHVGVLLLPGGRSPSLVLFALVIVVAWVGAAGAIWRRPVPTLVGGAGGLLLGPLRVTIGLIVVPVTLLLLATAFLVWGEPPEGPDRLLGR